MAQALIDHIHPEAILLGVNAANSEAVIRQLAARLESLGYVKPSYVDAVVKREQTMPTGLPLGLAENVAVPHTDPIHVHRAGVALAVLSQPVDFANMEEPDEAVSVGIVFLLAINDKDKQIEMLQEIMGAIQSPEALTGLKQATSVDDVRAILS
ncbi:PTS sugar transporter subunit IIA [Mesorhizobium retamae]|uniref:PTS sugar transporter subunit IIA n=1 Tax=Mesorhizobium retamae TaxID=2912854 RepID=A0ABS9QBF1_9HYPH|nr:PTS sugar transporter subunit IIA [Mesorhizobium sp. IRAMC:0171]MCG7504738.1 PTS sugar transporter subunit IIA [Mesorhizobium sp. IRAMC:0171]